MTYPPALPPPVADARPSPVGPFPLEPPVTVLLVDNDARVRLAIRQTIALEPDLLVVGDASDAVSALALAAARDPAVALVDVPLFAHGTGLELVETLSRRPGCSVVAMSVRSAARGEALAAGAVAFVEKGDDIEALLQSIRNAARRDR